ncbi:hypothetical protein V8G54_001715 [Vigna mungo]|uniref:Uncharacterized protein n=1 Tax=Vigna mungo TaxID=3915 RepID=A0AAQ3P6T7_VIGMU
MEYTLLRTILDRPPPFEDPKPLFTKALPPPVSLAPLGFSTFPSPPSLDTDRDRGCRTSLGLPPPAPILSLLTLDSPFFLFQSFELTPPPEPNPITFFSLSLKPSTVGGELPLRRHKTLFRNPTLRFVRARMRIEEPSSQTLPKHFVGDNGGAGGGQTVAARRWTQRATREKNQTAKWRFLYAREMKDAKTIRLVMEVRLGLVEIGLVAVEVAGEEGGGRRGRRIERRHARRRRNMRKLLKSY